MATPRTPRSMPSWRPTRACFRSGAGIPTPPRRASPPLLSCRARARRNGASGRAGTPPPAPCPPSTASPLTWWSAQARPATCSPCRSPSAPSRRARPGCATAPTCSAFRPARPARPSRPSPATSPPSRPRSPAARGCIAMPAVRWARPTRCRFFPPRRSGSIATRPTGSRHRWWAIFTRRSRSPRPSPRAWPTVARARSSPCGCAIARRRR